MYSLKIINAQTVCYARDTSISVPEASDIFRLLQNNRI